MKTSLNTLLICLSFLMLFSCQKDEEISKKNTLKNTEDDKYTKTTLDNNYTYTIPIIFHVLYKNKGDRTQYVPAHRLQEILNNVNDLFAGGVYGKSEHVNIRFIPAKYDERGKRLPIPGVEYVEWKEGYPIDPNQFMTENTGKYTKYIWEPNDYINVMLYHFAQDHKGNDIILGLSHMPYKHEDNDIEGLVGIPMKSISKHALLHAHCSSINSQFIFEESSRYKTKNAQQYIYNPADINVTLAHELGHYLGLYHPFTEKREDNGNINEDGCQDTDYCQDTPSYNRQEYVNYQNQYIMSHKDSSLDLQDLIKRQNCRGETFLSTNIMDYAYGLSFQFTKDQKKRIRNVLYNSPLIPGPKKTRSGSYNNYKNEKINLPVIVVR